jgi:2-hydroxychromene-2-carboxylate isomerase
VAEPPAVDFYYGLGSRYSYLASTRIAGLEAETGCRVRWRPLYSADLFAARGADPFAGPPVSGQYDWAWRRADAEAWADYYGVPYREPVDVRCDGRRLALAATAAGRLGALEHYSRRLFEAIFVEGTSLDDVAVRRIAGEVGLEGAGFAATLDDPETVAALMTTVREALAAGIFGVPGFVVAGQMFWGNDRLPLVRHRLLEGQAPNQRKRGSTQSGEAP